MIVPAISQQIRKNKDAGIINSTEKGLLLKGIRLRTKYFLIDK